jgi:MarR family transcriptional regulator, transcriptional regulator for hemolysin
MLGCQIISDQSISGNKVGPLGRELVFTAKDVREAFEAALERAGGSLGIWIVLNAVSDEGFLSHRMLASRAHVDGATITHHVDRAEKLGLVRREVDPDDRRVKRLRPTPKGTKLHKRLLVEVVALDAAMMAGITKAEQAAFRQTLAKIRANFG